VNDVNDVKEEVKEPKKLYHLEDGTEGSRSAYIRQEFLKNRPRGDLAKELGVSYAVVYAATANMHNELTDGKPGRGVGRGVIMEDGRSRAEHMREMLQQGKTRGEIAKHFKCPYATVYAATKELLAEGKEGARAHRGKVVITLEDGSSIGRAEHIRALHAAGKSRREIADKLDCDYAVVWAATKKPHSEGAEGAEVSEASEANTSNSNEADADDSDDDNEVDEADVDDVDEK